MCTYNTCIIQYILLYLYKYIKICKFDDAYNGYIVTYCCITYMCVCVCRTYVYNEIKVD
jgi:hypothetical protein